MDPNAALTLLRTLATAIDTADQASAAHLASDLASAFIGLDDWLTRDGFLPHDWATGTRHAIASPGGQQ